MYLHPYGALQSGVLACTMRRDIAKREEAIPPPTLEWETILDKGPGTNDQKPGSQVPSGWVRCIVACVGHLEVSSDKAVRVALENRIWEEAHVLMDSNNYIWIFLFSYDHL